MSETFQKIKTYLLRASSAISWKVSVSILGYDRIEVICPIDKGPILYIIDNTNDGHIYVTNFLEGGRTTVYPDSYNAYKSITNSIEQYIKSSKSSINIDVSGLHINYGGDDYTFGIKKLIFSNPATIVFWKDGTKTVVKCQDGETFDPEKGVALCYMKKALGNKSNFNNTLKKCLKWDGMPIIFEKENKK